MKESPRHDGRTNKHGERHGVQREGDQSSDELIHPIIPASVFDHEILSDVTSGCTRRPENLAPNHYDETRRVR